MLLLDRVGESMTRTMGNILIRGGGRDLASRAGKARNECDPQANHLHITMHSEWAQYLTYQTELIFGRR